MEHEERLADGRLAGFVHSSCVEGARLSWSALREWTHVAVTGTERDWLQVATGKSLQ